MWSWSSWDTKIQRTSAGSTTEKAVASHESRTSEQPVSTITGSAPRITRLLLEKTPAPPGSASQRGDEERVAGDGIGGGGQGLDHRNAFRLDQSVLDWIRLDLSRRSCIVKPMPKKSPVKTPAPSPAKRAYNSSRRSLQAAQTRDEVIRAAIARFSATGWNGTTLAAIADEAGVSVETIYNGFGSKLGLLRAAADAAVAGDTEPIPFVERPEFLDLGKGTLDERIARGAAVVANTHARVAGVWQAIVEASGGDDAIDAWRRQLEENRRLDTGRSLERVLGHPVDEQTAVAVLGALQPRGVRQARARRGPLARGVRDAPHRRVEATRRHQLTITTLPNASPACTRAIASGVSRSG